jgi:hypothetical protein
LHIVNVGITDSKGEGKFAAVFNQASNHEGKLWSKAQFD